METIPFRLLLIFFMFSILLCSCRNTKEIPLIGMGADGVEKIEYLPYSGYTKESANMLNEVGLHTVESLNYVESRNHNSNSNSNSNPNPNDHRSPPWQLKSFYIGFTVMAGVSIGIFGLEGQGTLNLFFDRK